MEEAGGHLSEYVYVTNVFHDVHSTLYMGNQHSAQGQDFLPKAISVFCSENLILFTVTSIHQIRKSTKYRNSKTRWESKIEGNTED